MPIQTSPLKKLLFALIRPIPTQNDVKSDYGGILARISRFPDLPRKPLLHSVTFTFDGSFQDVGALNNDNSLFHLVTFGEYGSFSHSVALGMTD